MIQLQPKNCFFYNEFYDFYFKSILKSCKVTLSYNFLIKITKRIILFVPSLIKTYFKYLHKIHSISSHNISISLNNTIQLILNQAYLLNNQIYKFKSNFKKAFQFSYLQNMLIYLYKSTTKGFKKILKVFGIAIGFLYI